MTKRAAPRRDPKVDAYLAALPPDQARLLGSLRQRVERLVPDAVEQISYGMPAFKLSGRFFLSYAGWKKHCSIYAPPSTFLDAHETELAAFDRTKGSLHFTPAMPLPDALLDEMILAMAARADPGPDPG